MNKEIAGLDSLKASDTEEVIARIADLLEDDERIEDFKKKLVSSINTVSYESIKYSVETEDGHYQLDVLYNTGSSEVEKHSLEGA